MFKKLSRTLPPWNKVNYDKFDCSMFQEELKTLNSTQSATISTFGSLSGSAKWAGGVLAPNGNIYGIPQTSTTILKIDPTTDTSTTFGSLSGTSKWAGGVLAPNGRIYCMPRNSTTILEIDPTTDTATTFGSLSESNKLFGGVLAPNGRIYGIPQSSIVVLAILEEKLIDIDICNARQLNIL